MARSTARRRALNTLFEADQRGKPVADVLRERIADPDAPTPLPEYAVTIVEGVAERLPRIDEILSTYSQGWTLDRMPAVDRAILRIGVWEILYNHEVPPGVAIDEALKLARTMSTDESPTFVHGVLGRIAELGPALSA